nr:hypothetical protein [Pantoea cypripedii]
MSIVSSSSGPQPLNSASAEQPEIRLTRIVQIHNTCHHHASSIATQAGEAVLKTLQSCISDYPYRPGKPHSPELNNTLEKIVTAILTEGETSAAGTPSFTVADIASEAAFIRAMDREYPKAGKWVQELKKILAEAGTPPLTTENNYNVLRVKVAKNPLCRLLLAIDQHTFRQEIIQAMPPVTPQGEQNSPEPGDPRLQRMQHEIAATRIRLAQAEDQRSAIVNEYIDKAEQEFLAKLTLGIRVSMRDVDDILEHNRHLDDRDLTILKRRLTIVVQIEDAVQHVIRQDIESNEDPFLEWALFASNYDINKVFQTHAVQQLQLSAEEHKKQRARLELAQIQTYRDDQLNSIFYREATFHVTPPSPRR